MTDFHTSTPHNNNVIVHDEKEMRKLDVVYMKQPKQVREEVVKDYAERLFERHGLDTNVPDEFDGYKLPVHVLCVQAGLCVRPWSDVELLLNNLPPRLAEYTLMRSDGEEKRIPLHHAAAGQAPRSVVDRMLALAPDSVQVKFSTGWLPLHFAASYNNADAIVSLMNAYPDALLERDIRDKTPIDVAIDENRNEALKIMLPAAVDKVCDASFHDYGNLMDKSKYNGYSNPLNLVFLECINDKRSCDDVSKFIHQLEEYPIIFRSFVRHALMSNTEASPRSYAHKIRFNDEYSRERVLNALKNAGDNTEEFASQDVSSSFDDSSRGSDRLSRRRLVEACTEILKIVESPDISITCRIFRDEKA